MNVSLKRGDTLSQRLAHGEDVNPRAQARVADLQVKECQSWPVNHQKPEMNKTFPKIPPDEPILATSWSWLYDPQGYGIMNFCNLNHTLCDSLIELLETNSLQNPEKRLSSVFVFSTHRNRVIPNPMPGPEHTIKLLHLKSWYTCKKGYLPLVTIWCS